MAEQAQTENQLWVTASQITKFSHAIFEAAGADAASAKAATDAMMHASLHGVDSHGFRLLAPLSGGDARWSHSTAALICPSPKAGWHGPA